MSGHSQKPHICKLLRRSSASPESAGALILNFPVSRTVRNQCLCNQLDFWHFYCSHPVYQDRWPEAKSWEDGSTFFRSLTDRHSSCYSSAVVLYLETDTWDGFRGARAGSISGLSFGLIRQRWESAKPAWGLQWGPSAWKLFPPSPWQDMGISSPLWALASRDPAGAWWSLQCGTVWASCTYLGDTASLRLCYLKSVYAKWVFSLWEDL